MTPRPANPHLAADILRATAELVEEKGAASVTMRDVAERVGYSPTTIYLYYQNKEELLDAAVTRAFEQLADHIEAARKSGDAPGRIREGSIAYVDWALRHPAMYRLMFELTRVRPLSEDTHRVRRRSWRASHAELAEGAAAGALPCIGDLDDAADMVWASMHGIASLTISGRLGAMTQRSPEDANARALSLADAQMDALISAWTGVCV